MPSALRHIRFLFSFTTLHPYCKSQSITTVKTVKTEFKLPGMKSKEQCLVKAIIRSFGYQECRFRLGELTNNHAVGNPAVGNPAPHELRNDDETEVKEVRIGEENSGNAGGSNGNGDNGSGDSKDNGREGGDEGQESNHKGIIGVEWWWWWKWQQGRRKSRTSSDGSYLWPVDTAVQVVANDLRGTIEPAVEAILLKPIRQNIRMQGFLLLLVFGAIVMSCIQMFAGLAVVSTGVSLAGVSALVLALIWWPRRQQSSPTQSDNRNDES